MRYIEDIIRSNLSEDDKVTLIKVAFIQQKCKDFRVPPGEDRDQVELWFYKDNDLQKIWEQSIAPRAKRMETMGDFNTITIREMIHYIKTYVDMDIRKKLGIEEMVDERLY